MFFQVHARIFNRDGVAQSGDILVADAVPAVKESVGFAPVSVDVAMTPTGDFVVVYDVGNLQTNNSVVMAHFYTVNGTDEGAVLVTPVPPLAEVFQAYEPTVARDNKGDTFISFLTQQDFGLVKVGVQILSPSTTPIGGPIVVSDSATGPLSRPSIATDGTGNFVVAWNADVFNPTPQAHIVFRRFAPDGKPIDSSAVDVATAQLSSTPSVGRAQDTGNFVITWDTASSGTTVIEAQRFDASGAPLGAPFQVNTSTSEPAQSPQVAIGAAGNFAISWTTGLPETVFSRVFNADGSAESPQLQVNGPSVDFGSSDIAVDSTLSQFIVNWPGAGNSGQDEILARIYRKPAPVAPAILPPSLPVSPPVAGEDPAIGIALERSTTRRAETPIPFFLPLTELPPPQGPVQFEPVRSLLPTPGAPGPEEQELRKMGEISGEVFLDLNGNGIHDEGEPGLAGQVVFLDLNDNGILDDGEPSVVTDSKGEYVFSGLPLTKYRVRQLVRPSRIIQTTPLDNAGHEVMLTRQNNTAPNQNFGTKILQTATPVSPPPSSTDEPPSRAGDDTPPE
jgi:hypothetical protein